MMNVRKRSFPGVYYKNNTSQVNKSLVKNQPVKTQIMTQPNNMYVNINGNNVQKVIPVNKNNKRKKKVKFGRLQVIDVESYKEYTLRDTYETEKIMQNLMMMAQGRDKVSCCFGRPGYSQGGENVKYCCNIF